MKAVFNQQVIAQSDETVLIEGNRYFPRESVNMQMLEASDHTTVCPWKGTASYYSVKADGKTCVEAAWSYEDPKADAMHIKDMIAFWREVEVGSDADSI